MKNTATNASAGTTARAMSVTASSEILGLSGRTRSLAIKVAAERMISEPGTRAVSTPAPLGIASGLFIGKQAGVLIAVFALVRLGLARRPSGAGWLELYGVALLCGVGFTISLFIGTLAFTGQGELARSQMTLGVFAGSVASALAGMGILALAARIRTRAA